eukprot:CAMPEP_0178703778 /NCGR_PEP_ID=MMETSP0699-20121125/13763_1 /TAXON_ID=265572 /ORGANISM="Extubocellulus spinifer, Strain CCMP396" /LENGTH=315 /DNA_ID=CAMNT_0020350951 /DNA_START=57 /DNA_END=1004 /DNA_ORIENTATION=+
MIIRTSFRRLVRGASLQQQLKRSYTCAITRGIPDSFVQALSSKSDPQITISVPKAREEHAEYVSFMRSAVPTVHLPASEQHPDCPFVEDAAVVIGNRAVICRIGADSRKGEVGPIREALSQLGLEIVEMANECESATVDGGDVLHPVTSFGGDFANRQPSTSVGRYLFVGLSGRTNMDGVKVLDEAFRGYKGGIEVIAVPIPDITESGALHLKSIVTHVDENTLLVPSGRLGDEVLAAMKAEERGFDAIRLPDIAACNVVAINGVVMASPTECKESTAIFETGMNQRGYKIKYIPNIEYAKCDGAMTCRSILLDI